MKKDSYEGVMKNGRLYEAQLRDGTVFKGYLTQSLPEGFFLYDGEVMWFCAFSELVSLKHRKKEEEAGELR